MANPQVVGLTSKLNYIKTLIDKNFSYFNLIISKVIYLKTIFTRFTFYIFTVVTLQKNAEY